MSFRVSDVQEYFDTLDQRFTAEGSKGVTATYQFNLEPSGTWHVNVSDGSFSVHEGAAEKPTTTFIIVALIVKLLSLNIFLFSIALLHVLGLLSLSLFLFFVVLRCCHVSVLFECLLG